MCSLGKICLKILVVPMLQNSVEKKFFGEFKYFYMEKSFILKNFFTEKKRFLQRKIYAFILQKKIIFLIMKNIFVKN